MSTGRQKKDTLPYQRRTGARRRTLSVEADRVLTSTPNPFKQLQSDTEMSTAADIETSQEQLDAETGEMDQPPEPVDPVAKMMAFMEKKFATVEGNFANLDTKLTATGSKVEKLVSTVAGVSAKCDNNSAEIKKLARKVESDRLKDKRELEQKIDRAISLGAGAVGEDVDERIKAAVAKQLDQVSKDVDKLKAVQSVRNSSHIAVQRRRVGSSAEDEERAFWWARKQLRCYPVPGKTKKELETNLASFLRDNLAVPEDEFPPGTFVEIKRIAAGRKKRGSVEDEVLVTFPDIQTRDIIASYAPNLRDWREKNKAAPNAAGIRIEVPDHLCGVFRNLERYGHALKMQHGQGFKRRTKYDDGLQTLYMDAVLPGVDQDWFRISGEEAAAMMRERLGSNTSNRSGSRSEVNDEPMNTDERGGEKL